MSKTIVMQESGLGKELTLDKLRAGRIGGGSDDYLPVDSINLVKIVVRENGTYKASDFGAYGIAEVRVACTEDGGSATSASVSKEIADTANPEISEGGESRMMAAKFLKTNLKAGGTCLWARESAVNLGTKYINVDNRTYRAVDDGYFAYSQVSVSGISVTTGIDDDGDEIVTVEDGEGTTTEKVPSTIAVTTLPVKVIYATGDVIDYTGIVVKAYLASGGLYDAPGYPGGVIPFNELIFPKTTVEAEKTIYTDDNGLYFCRIECATECRLFNNDLYYASSDVGVFTSGGATMIAYAALPGHAGSGFATFYNGHLYIYFDDRQSGGTALAFDNAGVITSWGYSSDNFNNGFKQFFDVRGESPESLVNPDGKKPTDYHEISGGMSVPVQWERPGDHKLLETAFEIIVT